MLTVLALANAGLVYALLWSDTGLLAYNELKRRHAELTSRLEELDEQSVELSSEIRLLKSDRKYIEKKIREQMNFLRQDEILYIFPAESVSGEAGSDE